jgi:hypothetical protein
MDKEALIVFVSIIGTLFIGNIIFFACLLKYMKRAKKYKVGMKNNNQKGGKTPR